MGTFELITDDVTHWAQQYKGPKFHSLLSDFPYDLGFMGKYWDKNAKFKQWGEALLPTLLPGAISLVFGGTRTWHRLASGLEDAGFEMWDTMMWLYSQGFPKAQAISKLVAKTDQDGSNWIRHKTTALKPAWEPILCLKHPLEATYAQTALEHGSGALNVDGTRIVAEKPIASHLMTTGGHGHTTGTFNQLYRAGDSGKFVRTDGRFPANLLLDEEAAQQLDEQVSKASRFFYVAKTTAKERGAGMPDGTENEHPTLKPVRLTYYLAKLLLPPASVGVRRIIVPFSGSGSEVIGCLLAGWDEVVGVELDGAFTNIAKHRCLHALQGGYDQFIS